MPSSMRSEPSPPHSWALSPGISPRATTAGAKYRNAKPSARPRNGCATSGFLISWWHLHSEILAGIVANRRQLTKEDAEYAMAQETPFATADETDFVFDSVKDDLSILPAEVIHSVVQYYRTAKQSNLLTADLRDPYFLRQTPSEKRRIIGHLLQIVETQKILGEAALSDLSAFAGKQGLDLRENETRAGKLLLQAREEMKLIFKKSERSARPSKPPEKRKRKLS